MQTWYAIERRYAMSLEKGLGNRCSTCFGHKSYYDEDGVTKRDCERCKGTGKEPKQRRPKPLYSGRKAASRPIDECYITAALRTKLNKSGSVFLPQFEYDGRQIDGLQVSISAADRIVAYEIKTDYRDFENELDSQKYKHWFNYTTDFFFVCPEAMIPVNKLPLGCGLVYIDDRDQTRIVHTRQQRPYPIALPVQFQKRLWRRMVMVEGYVI